MLKIMVIASESFGITIITGLLEKMGHDAVVSAESGAEAIQLLGYVTCDLILCDLNMPDMDGIELMRHIAGLETSPAVILMSREDKKLLAATERLAKARKLNLLGTVKKPIRPSSLKALVDLLTGKKEPAATLAGGGGAVLSVAELEAGLAEQRICVFVQPKIAAQNFQVVGVEALARWKNDDGSILSPYAFVPTAENNGLMTALTDAVIDASLETIKNWPPMANNLKLSINVSIENLTDLSFADTLVGKAKAAGVPLNRLILEVTETKLMEDILGPLDILSRLRLRGVGLSIDDFGTGAASFENLQTLPFTELKIDRGFVDGAWQDRDKRAILSSIFAVAKKLEIDTVAEGVEQQEDWDLLKHMGCGLIQGFLMAKPMNDKDFINWLRAHNTQHGLFFTHPLRG